MLLGLELWARLLLGIWAQFNNPSSAGLMFFFLHAFLGMSVQLIGGSDTRTVRTSGTGILIPKLRGLCVEGQVRSCT